MNKRYSSLITLALAGAIFLPQQSLATTKAHGITKEAKRAAKEVANATAATEKVGHSSFVKNRTAFVEAAEADGGPQTSHIVTSMSGGLFGHSISKNALKKVGLIQRKRVTAKTHAETILTEAADGVDAQSRIFRAFAHIGPSSVTLPADVVERAGNLGAHVVLKRVNGRRGDNPLVLEQLEKRLIKSAKKAGFVRDRGYIQTQVSLDTLVNVVV